MKPIPGDAKRVMFLCFGIAALLAASGYCFSQWNAAREMKAMRQDTAQAIRQVMPSFPSDTPDAPAASAATLSPATPGPAIPPPAAPDPFLSQIRLVLWSFGSGRTIPPEAAMMGVHAGDIIIPVKIMVENKSGQVAGSVTIRLDGYLNNVVVVSGEVSGSDVPPHSQKVIDGLFRLPSGIKTDRTTAVITDADAGPSHLPF
jgi:hypothetical protein